MYISTNAIVSNSDMIRNYKKCREKAEGLGKVFILKFNEPDAVLFSILEYEKITKSLERIKNKEDDEIVTIKEDDEIVIIKEDDEFVTIKEDDEFVTIKNDVEIARPID